MLRLFAPLVVIGFLSAGAPHAQIAPKEEAARPAAKPATVVNLNTATVAELEKLPGIGQKVAARIVEYRQKNGQFKKIEELMNVQGIGEKSFLKIKDRLTVGARSAEKTGTPL